MEVFEKLKSACAHRVVPFAFGGDDLFAKTPTAKQWATIRQLMTRSQRESDDEKGAESLLKAEALTLEMLCDKDGLAVLTEDQIEALQAENGAMVSEIAGAIVDATSLAGDATGAHAKN